MKPVIAAGLAALFVLWNPLLTASAQDTNCRALDPDAGRRFLPDKVPLEMELIPVDGRSYAALQFPDRSRIAIAALSTSGLSAEIQKKYQYIFISETRIKLDRWNIPAGMVGMGTDAGDARDGPTRTLVARDFSGSEIDRIQLQLDSAAKEGGLSFVPKGPKEFELRIGRYVVQGSQR